jgi:hypothetical protein
MRIALLLSLGITLAWSSQLQAQGSADADDARTLELALSDETAQVRYDAPSDIGGEDSHMFYTVFLSEERDVVGTAGLLLGSDLNFGALDIKFGPQAYAALLDDENEDVFAIALGVEARFNLIPSRGISIVGNAYFSPDVVTFGSADNLTDFMARAEMRLNDRLVGFAGYRWFELDLLQGDERRLQNELFAGVKWQL